MRASRCLFNSATAIRKVFISNALAFEAPGYLQRMLLPALTISSQPSSTWPSRRPFSTHQVARFRSSGQKSDADAIPAGNRVMRDDDITYPWVQLRQDDGRLAPPERTSAILRSLDTARYSLVLLAAPRRDSRSAGPAYPICRIVDRKAEYAARVEKEVAKKKEPKVVLKEMELNWAIAPNDLRTRMKQLKTFLGKGYKVQITLLTKKKRSSKKRATPDEAREVLRAVREAMAEVPGTKEYKPMDGAVGETVMIYAQGPAGGAEEPPAEPGASPVGS
ncbi:hypothetical protein VTK56DRAFT_8990 [Thermocarpiscus australiensis]